MSGNARVVVGLTEITKAFPGVLANDAISFEVVRGEVHCLLGENGAGKSTLISILAGLQQPDSGVIEIDGLPVALTSPSASIARGIGVVYQHSTLVPNLTVLENLMLGDTDTFWLGRDRAISRLHELSEMLGFPMDPDLRAGDLELGQQQQVEIAKAIWKGSNVLILDEPTSMLVPQAIEQLMVTVNRLKAEGLAIVFVTHKLHEAIALGDAVTVLRGGKVTGRITPDELRVMPEDQARAHILGAMFGDAAAAIEATGVGAAVNVGGPRRTGIPADEAIALEVQRLSTAPRAGIVSLRDVSLTIRSGEIVGVAGIDGQGQRHLAEAIAGQIAPHEGAVLFDSTDISTLGVRARQRLGVRYLTDDRLHEGIVGSMSVAVNLLLKKIGERPFWKFGRMNKQAVRDEARRQIADYEIRTPSEEARAGSLSGGNIQKILLARELSYDPRVVVFHKPTVGLDLKTVAHVRDVVRDYADGGGATLLISSDLDELAELCDRILVISGGRLVGEVHNDSVRVPERVGELMVGGRGAGHELGAIR